MKILYLPNEYSQQRQKEKKRWIWPVHLAMEATYMRDNGHDVVWGASSFSSWADKIVTEPEGIPFDKLPCPDRWLTKSADVKYQNNGNFKYRPGTYMQAASGCWWGNCTFCVEKDRPRYVRPVADVIFDIHSAVHEGYREIFDDSATFPVGSWLEDFCYRMKEYQRTRGKIVLGCNMRFGALEHTDYLAMKKAGFRMILWGLESASQMTLDFIQKGININDAVKELIISSQYGLENHVAVMFGYPWENESDSIKTLKLVHWLLRKGYAKTAQASFYNPTGADTPRGCGAKYVNQIYHAAAYPEFWFNQLKDIRNKDDINFLWRKIKAGLGR